MKKILFVLAVLLLAAGGFLFYQRSRLSHEFTLLAQGNKYFGYGLSLEIPPGASGMRGLLRPYVEVQGVRLSFRLQDKEWKTELGTGVLAPVSWWSKDLALKIPHVSWQQRVFDLKNLAFGLEGQNIVRIQADDLQVDLFSSVPIGEALQTGQGKSKPPLHITAPRLELGPWSGVTPDRFAFSWEKLNVGSSTSPDAHLVLEKMSAEFASKVENGRCRWDFSLQTPEGQAGDRDDHFTLRPARLESHGSFKELSFEDLQKSYREIASEGGINLQGFTQGLAAGPSQEKLQKLLKVYFNMFHLVVRLDFRPEGSKFNWGGFDFQSEKHAQQWHLGEVEGKGNVRYEPKAFSANGMFLLKEFQGKYDLGDKYGKLQLDAEGLKFSYNGEYKIAYEDLWKNWLDYYQSVAELFHKYGDDRCDTGQYR
ncbi:MAG TPA: hypothetical protein DF383_06660, partial [Deltaproteobacteria bacterium]|nr:hypothetical protein [Deltaproteobacteria bacterium]